MNTHKIHNILMLGVGLTFSMLAFSALPSPVAAAAASPTCAAATPSVVVGDYATFNAFGGSGTYFWTGGQLPPTGSGSSFTTQYTTTGTKTVTVDDGGTTANCSVEVVPVPTSVCTVNVSAGTCGQIRVTSNIGTTWRITGADGQIINQTEDAGTTPVVYDKTVCGLYSISNIPERAGAAPVVTPATSGDLVQGGVLEFNINYNAPVDLKANGLDGGVKVLLGQPAYLTWTTNNIQSGSCEASSDPLAGVWSGPKADQQGTPGDPSGNITENILFTLTCLNEKGASVSDSVDVSPHAPECSDREDNDGDNKIDCPDDPGCYPSGGDTCDPLDNSEANVAQCDDGLDNDGDGFIDWDGEDNNPETTDDNDPGCSGPLDDDEYNSPTTVTQCNDGLDNDGDLETGGGVDFSSVGGQPVDPDCESALDPSELKDPDIREI